MPGDLALKVIQFSKIAVKVAMQQDFDIIHAHDWMTYLAGRGGEKSHGQAPGGAPARLPV